MVAASSPHVNGRVAPGYEPVMEAFHANFAEQQELGAAFAAFRHGQLIVDLWGGTADTVTGRPWEQDTLQLIFSGTKGLVAVCLLKLIDSGRLALTDRVCQHWPEFAAAGKDQITVSEIVSHRARLPGITTPVTVTDLVDDTRMAQLLADQPPIDDPRAASTYHALTYGWLCGELIRRVDGRSVGTFFAEEIAGPLGLELWIGLPEAEHARVSRLQLGSAWAAAGQPYGDMSDDPLAWAVWRNPPVFGEAFPWNDAAVRSAEMPGVNAVGTARSVAALYGNLDRVLSADAQQLGRTQLARSRDPLLDEPQAFGVGFQLQTEAQAFGPAADGYGHAGAGGSVHGTWPSENVGFSYAMNLMRDDPDDRRARSLLEALHRCVRAQPARR